MASASKQAQLRSLMKQKQSATPDTSSTTNRVEHKLAHYTAKGDLVCLLCKLPVKSSSLWSAHCATPTHKQKLEIYANKLRQQSAAKDTAPTIEDEAVEPSAKRPKLIEPSTSEMHHSVGPTPDQPTSAPEPPAEDEGPNNEEALKQLRAEWEEQEATILKTQKMDAEATDENEDTGPMVPMDEDDEESDDDLDELVNRPVEDELLNAKHGAHRLTLLQEQKQEMGVMVAEEEEEEDDESEDDSESSEEVDIDNLYNWRSRAV